MKKSIAARRPDEYLASLNGWQRRYAEALRAAVADAEPLQETIKWGRSTVAALVKAAVALNAALGDPTDLKAAGAAKIG